MNRRSFIQSLSLAGAGVALAPIAPFAAVPIRTIYKVNCLVFEVFYWKRDNFGKMFWNSRIVHVRAFKGTLKDLLNWYPNDEIFFYEELMSEFIPGRKVNIVRAGIINKEPGMNISRNTEIETLDIY
jgi:hypothetical protein